MQTFLPCQTFKESVKCLDNKRLIKQRLEAYQLWNTVAPVGRISKKKRRVWYHHPARLQWVGFHQALWYYLYQCENEMVRRGFNVNRYTPKLLPPGFRRRLRMPPWYTAALQKCHRARLLYKDKKYYKQFGWKERPTETYKYWPVRWNNKSGCIVEDYR